MAGEEVVWQNGKGAINEYRLIVPLSDDLAEKISYTRKALHEKYGVPLPFEIKPSLTVLKFVAFEQNEPKVVDRLNNAVIATDPFVVELEDYAGYPSHTIYINVKTRSAFNDFSKTLKKWKRYFTLGEHQPHYINEPHLILAQRLAVHQFEKMWRECEHKQFSGKFITNGVQLLKRGEKKKRYEVIRELPFQQLPLHLKQASLFS